MALSSLLGKIWRKLPRVVKRSGMWLAEPRFAVTVAALVVDEAGRALVLEHNFRPGSGWGIPGGFVERGESPEAALRRELREELGLEAEEFEYLFARTLRRPQQVEIYFRCRAPRDAKLNVPNFEIKSARWCAPDELPENISKDQRRLIERALGNGA